MTISKSGNAALVLAVLAAGAIALAAPAASAAPVHARIAVEPAARVQAAGGVSARRTQIAQPQKQVADPFASLLLG